MNLETFIEIDIASEWLIKKWYESNWTNLRLKIVVRYWSVDLMNGNAFIILTRKYKTINCIKYLPQEFEVFVSDKCSNRNALELSFQ